MQEAGHAVLCGELAHDLHGELVLVGGEVCGGEYGGKLVLCGGDLVMLGLCVDAELPKLLVQLLHEGCNSRLDGAEVMVIQLLTLGRARAEQGAAGVDEVLALFVHRAVDEEILLLGADGALYGFDLGVAEEAQDAQRLLIDALHGAQQRCFLVKRFAAVGAENGRNAEDALFYKCVGGGVPAGVASRLKGGAQTAGGEGGSIRFAADKLFTGKLHNDLAVGGGGDKAVVLLGGDTGHRLEPVSKVGSTLLDSPVLHGVGNDVCNIALEGAALADGALERFIGVLGQALAHDGIVENH